MSPRFQLALVLAAALIPALAAPVRAEIPTRTHGDLVIEDPPRARTEATSGRWATAIEGALTRGSQRVWVGAPVPAHVDAGFDKYELVDLLPTPTGHLALYFEPFGRGDQPGCALENMWENCGAVFRFYTADGALAWQHDAAALFPRPDHLVVHNFALDGDTLYYAEACQTYAKDAKGKCSQVVALDVAASPPVVRWRSAPRLSNSDLVPMGRWLVTGYGFTAERDFLYVLDRATGKQVAKAAVKKAPERITRREDGRLDVLIYDADAPVTYALIDGKRPRLRLDP